jgi:hypothetical protein
VNAGLQGLCERVLGRAAAEREAGERRAAGLPGDALGDVPQDVRRVGRAAEPLRRHAPQPPPQQLRLFQRHQRSAGRLTHLL